MDGTGNVYVADSGNNRVLELPSGSNTPVDLGFTDLKSPVALAVDCVGNVYVVDDYTNQVLKLQTR